MEALSINFSEITRRNDTASEESPSFSFSPSLRGLDGGLFPFILLWSATTNQLARVSSIGDFFTQMAKGNKFCNAWALFLFFTQVDIKMLVTGRYKFHDYKDPLTEQIIQLNNIHTPISVRCLSCPGRELL
jgi:hypothetical protein